jgi:hypothetical protein
MVGFVIGFCYAWGVEMVKNYRKNVKVQSHFFYVKDYVNNEKN